MGSSVLQVSRHDAIAVVTLHRPGQRNAVDRELADAVDAALGELDADESVRVVVLTGGPSFFSAGTDLHEPSSPATPDGGEYGLIRRHRSTPIVAAVEGFALGGGFEIVLACDLVVAADDVRFGLPEVKRGVIANCGAFFRAPAKLPANVATQMLLTGETLPARRAHELGLVNVLCSPGSALDAALELAAAIVPNSPSAVRITFEALQAAQRDAERDLWPLTDDAAAQVRVSADSAEGIAAFFEKRAPRWSAPGAPDDASGTPRPAP